MMRDLRLYMLVGGMPQSIETYNETNNLQLVDAKKREILELYDDDFRKIDPLGRASKIMRAIPGQLNSNARRYKLSSAMGSRRTDGTDVVVALTGIVTLWSPSKTAAFPSIFVFCAEPVNVPLPFPLVKPEPDKPDMLIVNVPEYAFLLSHLTFPDGGVSILMFPAPVFACKIQPSTARFIMELPPGRWRFPCHP